MQWSVQTKPTKEENFLHCHFFFQTVPKEGREKDSDAYVNNTTTTNDSAGTRTPTIREIGLFRYKFQIIRICAFSYQ